MAKVIFPADMQCYTDDLAEVEVSAENYRELVAELRGRFPRLTDEVIRKQSIAIDGMIIHTPLLEAFHQDSKVVLFPRLAGG